MNPCIPIRPLELKDDLGHLVVLHIDNYNRLYVKRDGGFHRLECKECRGHLQYFEAWGILCSDNYTHRTQEIKTRVKE